MKPENNRHPIDQTKEIKIVNTKSNDAAVGQIEKPTNEPLILRGKRAVVFGAGGSIV
jgi:hypothetical protein